MRLLPIAGVLLMMSASLAVGENVSTLCEAEQQPASCAYTALLADLAFLSIACGWLIQAR